MNAQVRYLFSLLILLLAMGGCSKSCSRKEPAQSQRVFFIAPKDGDTVAPTFSVKFGIEGMRVRPAGEDLTEKTSGHHHVLIDNPKGFIKSGSVVPADKNHIHYGKGQTESKLTLPEGKHTISLQFANGAHLSYGKKLSTTITIIVKKG